MAKIDVNGMSVTVISGRADDYPSLTDIRDEANASQLVCLANLEMLNSHFIHQRVAQAERLKLLNQTAIQQMKLLLADAGARRLEGKQP